MVRALQPGRRRLSWHAPHAEAGDPQPEAATQQTGFQPVQQGPKASGSEAGPQQQPTEDRSQVRRPDVLRTGGTACCAPCRIRLANRLRDALQQGWDVFFSCARRTMGMLQLPPRSPCSPCRLTHAARRTAARTQGQTRHRRSPAARPHRRSSAPRTLTRTRRTGPVRCTACRRAMVPQGVLFFISPHPICGYTVEITECSGSCLPVVQVPVWRKISWLWHGLQMCREVFTSTCRALEDLCELESPAALGEAASNQPLISAASLSSLHFNALYDASGSPGKALVAQGEAPASQAPGRGTPDHKRRGGTKLAATRSMFDSPPAGLQSPPTTVLRDIAGRWHSPSQ